jgi:hypothetical protein
MAFTQMATNLFLSSANGFSAVQNSAAVRLHGASYITVQAELVSITSTSGHKLLITTEISDDGLNWRQVASSGSDLRIPLIQFTNGDAPALETSASVTGTAPGTPATLQGAFLRLRYEVQGTDAKTIVSAGINVSRA